MLQSAHQPRTVTSSRQLLVYEFPPGAEYAGHLIGALERVESGGAMRILDALFVAREADSGEVAAVSMTSDGPAGMIGRMLSFRLDAYARAGATRRALRGPAGELARSLASSLQPGGAVLALLVEHAWVEVLTDAVSRAGGVQSANRFVEHSRITQAWTEPA